MHEIDDVPGSPVKLYHGVTFCQRLPDLVEKLGLFALLYGALFKL